MPSLSAGDLAAGERLLQVGHPVSRHIGVADVQRLGIGIGLMIHGGIKLFVPGGHDNIAYLVGVGLFFADGGEIADDVFRQLTYGLGDCSEYSVRNTPL